MSNLHGNVKKGPEMSLEVHKRVRNELKAFLILFREVRQVDMVKWT